MALVNMAQQFKGLPMQDLIGGPLKAASDSQIQLAQATANFIKVIGFKEPAQGAGPDDVGDPRIAKFTFKRPVQQPADSSATGGPAPIAMETVEMDVPMLAIVNIPALSIKNVDITFDMEVSSSESNTESKDSEMSLDASASVGWGVFKATVKVHGKVATHKENTRKSDNSAKYHVEVHARDDGMPEGLSRVLDIMQSAVAPSKVTPP